VIADLNGDGKLDLVTANGGSNTVSVLLGNGDGSFGVWTDFETEEFARSVAVGDLNGDGRPDLAVATMYSNTISVLLGKGDGSFSAKAGYGTGKQPEAVAIGDLNGDGRPDLAVANGGWKTVSVLINTAGGIPTPVTLALVDARAAAGHVALRWVGSSMAGVTATVYRRTVLTAWAPMASILGDGTGTLRFEDTNVQPGTRHGYRLGVREGAVEKFYGEAWVSVPPLALALVGLRPNPAVGELVASFTLPSGSPARLVLLDVTGRTWLTREVGDLGAGSHLVRLGGSAPAGIYWLRLTQGGRSLFARGVVVK